jgi:hypothetical protein
MQSVRYNSYIRNQKIVQNARSSSSSREREEVHMRKEGRVQSIVIEQFAEVK